MDFDTPAVSHLKSPTPDGMEFDQVIKLASLLVGDFFHCPNA